MKSIKFISALTLALALASCDNFDLPNPPGQTNVDQAAFANTDLALTQAAETINLKEANQANTDVKVADITKLENFPEGYNLVIEMEVGSDANFTNISTVNTTIVDNAVMVNPDAFNGGIQGAITKEPGVYDVPVRLVAYAVKDNTRVRIGGENADYGQYLIKVTTLDPSKVIEDLYYLVTSSDQMVWKLADAVAMANTAGSNVSAYDNPQFSVKIDVTEKQATEGLYYTFIPASSYDAKNLQNQLGVNANGKLIGYVKDTEKNTSNAGKLGPEYAGSILFTIDMEAESCQVNFAFDQLWAFTSVATAMPLYTSDYITYKGAAVITTKMRLGQEPNLQGILYEEVEGSREETGEGIFNGKLELKKGSGITSNLKGKQLYWIDINLPAMTYSVEALQTLSLVGDMNDWKEKEGIVLTADGNKTKWTAKGVELNTMFKVVANNSWDFAFGGAGTGSTGVNGETVLPITKVNGDPNIECTPGTYDVTVDFTVYPYTVTLTSK